MAAKESGIRAIDDGDANAQSGTGYGLLQIDSGGYWDFTHSPLVYDPYANASFGADKIGGYLKKCASVADALDHYNGGHCGAATSLSEWTKSSDVVTYDVSVLRHQQRIKDYKAVCPNGHRS